VYFFSIALLIFRLCRAYHIKRLLPEEVSPPVTLVQDFVEKSFLGEGLGLPVVAEFKIFLGNCAFDLGDCVGTLSNRFAQGLLNKNRDSTITPR
jgi:hypothetical protein